MERSAKEHLPAERPADKGTADEGTPDKAGAAEAADLIELNGDDLRREPLDVRKATLASLLSKARAGIRVNEHIEADGPTVFAHACRRGLRGSCPSAKPRRTALGARQIGSKARTRHVRQ